MMTPESQAYDMGCREMTERLADWMTDHSFSTGHGDTMRSLLGELYDQIVQLREQRAELLEACKRFVQAYEEQGGPPEVESYRMMRAAIAKAEAK